MAHHDDLLTLARHLVTRHPGEGVEADLRRGVSTAYYALFHLLIHEATARIVAIPAMRERVIRAFEHRDMKKVCEDYSSLVDPLGQPIPQEIQEIASAFVTLQLARHNADYNLALPLTEAQAITHLQRSEEAFVNWTKIQASPGADAFLTDLLFQSIRKR